MDAEPGWVKWGVEVAMGKAATLSCGQCTFCKYLTRTKLLESISSVGLIYFLFCNKKRNELNNQQTVFAP